MKQLFLILALAGAPLHNLISQELGEIKSIQVNNPWIELIPVKDKGFLIFEYQARNLNEQQAGLLISRYDLNLAKAWDSMLPFTKGLQLSYYQLSDGDMFIIFSDEKHRHLEIFRLSTEDAKGYKLSYDFSNPFTPDKVLANGSKIWMTGVMEQQGVLFELSANANNYRVLPTAFAQPVTAVHGIQYHHENNTISYLLKTKIDKRSGYVFRGWDVVKGRVIFDMPLMAQEKYHLDQARIGLEDNGYFITGTFHRKDPEQTDGLFQYHIRSGNAVSENFRLFKEIEGFDSYFMVASDGPQTKSAGKNPFLAHIDKILFENGEFIVSLELMEKEYMVKGSLQQEFEKSSMVNFLDQDQSGRRSFNQADNYVGTGQSAEDRIYQGSATDILNYRYRHAIIGQPIFQGFSYNRSVVLQFRTDMTDLSCVGIEASSKEVNFVHMPNTFIEQGKIRQLYDSGGVFNTWIYDPETRKPTAFKETVYLKGEGRLFHLDNDFYLGTNLLKQAGEFILTLQKVIP
jgi:hypothetical protein